MIICVKFEFKETVYLCYAIVEEIVDLSGGKFHSVNCQGIQIKGELILYWPKNEGEEEKTTKWQKSAVLDLNATRIRILRDARKLGLTSWN